MSGTLQSLRELARGLADGLLRVAVLVFGALAAVVALATGLALALGLILWSLLRGRRPLPPNVFVRRSRASPPVPPAEIVDVQAREVPPSERPPQG